MDGTEKFVLEERADVRRNRTVRMGIVGTVLVFAVATFVGARCSVERKRQEVLGLPAQVELRRLEFEQAAAASREAALLEMEKWNLYDACLVDRAREECDRAFFPERTCWRERAQVVHDMYVTCLKKANVKDWDCADYVEDLMASVDRGQEGSCL